MNEQEEFHEPLSHQDEMRERRRERRLEFISQCQLMVVAPPWALTNRPINGTTEDITLNGLKINLLHLEVKRAQRWAEAIAGDEELKVQIRMTALEGFPILRGQIVWMHNDGIKAELELGEEEVLENPASVGVLFGLMRPNEKSHVEKLVEELS